MIAESHLQALRVIADAAYAKPPVSWALTGSTSFALQGVDVTAHDIDIMTDERGAYALERRLLRYSVMPVRYSEAERIKSHFGLLNICGVDTEIMGDIQKRLPDGAWEPVFALAPITIYIEYGGTRIPVVSLRHEVKAYRLLGRTERADLLEAHISRMG